MDTRTLAAWIGHDRTDYDLDTAADALTAAGITDLDADPEAVIGVLAQHERHDDDAVAVMGQELLALARAGGGTWGEPVAITVGGQVHEGSTAASIRATLDGETRHLWIRPDGTGDGVTALHEAWEDATSTWEGEERELTADLRRTHQAALEAKRAYDEALAARRARVQAWTGSGRSMYRAAQIMGVSQTAVQRIVK